MPATGRMEKSRKYLALVEGDEEEIADFKELVETRKPELSEVSSIAFEDYGGDVMGVGDYAQVCTALQINKAIPLLLKIQNNTSATPHILEELKGLREDIQPGYATNFRQMQTDIRAIKDRLGMS